MKSMKALLWDGNPYPEGLYMGEAPIPQVKPGWVLIRNIATGICGSDLHYLAGGLRHQILDENLPAVMGHENAGIVMEIGQGVEGFSIGDRVVGEPLHACYAQGIKLCPACETGQYHQCDHLGHVGIPARLRLPGGFGEYSLYHQSSLFKIPDHVSFEEASVLDVTACGVHAFHLSQVKPGDRVAVFGMGAIGLCVVQCLRAAGVTEIIGITPFEYQVSIARQLGVSEVISYKLGEDPTPQILKVAGGVDFVFEAVGGTADTMQQAIDICKNGAKIIMLGFFEGERPVNLHKVFLKELSILASDGYSTWGKTREFGLALQMLARKQISHQKMITHIYDKSTQWKEGFEAAFKKQQYQSIKVVLNTPV